jgi:hypothetical protein
MKKVIELHRKYKKRETYTLSCIGLEGRKMDNLRADIVKLYENVSRNSDGFLIVKKKLYSKC